ncbi:MAG: hypothetical protein HFE04_00660, partial [Bacilli bacterium]|nr:hypothetical protein [Bacilli bacterium]
LYLGAEHSKESDSYKEYFIEFIFDSLCGHNNKYLEESERKILQEELYKKIETRSIKKIDYQNLMSSPETIKTIFYLKFGKISRNMNYIEDIPYKIIMHLNTKHINQIIKLMDLKNEDELSNIYSYAIRLYLAFGLEKSLLILQGKFGSLNFKFYENLGKLDIKDIELIKEGNKYIPKTPEHFNHFMFANNQNNHFSEMLNGKEPKLNEYWSYLFNYFKEIKERCNGTLTIKKLNIILKELSPTQDIDDIAPDNYKLCENNILNDVFLGNKTKKPKEEIYKKLLDIYERMKKRIESSIPYIKGKASNGYTYEMMKLNDPIVFTLGYKCDCCIRVGDIAHKHIEHATLCRNGRILITYDENGNIASFTPLKRNGEVLIANSIECLHKELNPKAITATKEALENIAKLSQSNKKEETPINLICIGKGAYAKPDGIPFPPDISTPTIYEKDDINYQSTDFYHTKLIIIYQNPSINLHQIKYGNPTISYKDPRNEIRKVSFKGIINNEIENALNIINAVRYANTSLENLKNFKKCGKYGINECVYNDDWYILTTIDGKIYGEYIKYDERAQIEYEITYKEISQKLEKDDKNTLTKKFK